MIANLLHTEIALGALAGLALGLLLISLRPADRATVRGMLVMLAVCLVLDLIGGLLGLGGALRGPPVLHGIAAVGMGIVLIRMVGMLVFRVALPPLGLSTPRIVEDLSATGLSTAWLLFWLHGAGLDLTGLLATSAVITAVLAFAMQDTLGNVLGGVVLQLDDSVRVGDWVKCDGIGGQVVDVGWRHTAIETRDCETVIVPNGWLVKNRFHIIGSRREQETRWRRWLYFNLDLSTPPRQVCEVLEGALNQSEVDNVLREPPPSAVLMEVGQGYARYALRYWLRDPRPDDPTDSTVRMHVIAALARHRIRLAVVQEERLITKENESRRAAQLASELAQRTRALAGVELFGSLSDAEREALAASMVTAPFVRGDTITRQGAVAHWLYLVVEGEVDVWTGDEGQRRHIATLHAGSVFGEMGLMTGEPRRANVTARTDAVCLRLDKAAFESILRARPDIASEVSQVIASRLDALHLARRNSDENHGHVAAQDAIRSRIRRFFGLD